MKLWFTISGIIIFSFGALAQDDYVSDKKIKNKKGFTNIPNPDFTNYTFTASAYTLKKRDFRFTNTDVVFTKISYGLTNNTMVSGNMSFAGTFVGSIKHKINLNEGFDLAFTGSIGQALYLPTDSFVMVTGGQSIFTFGDYQNNFTIGAGFYYAKANYIMVNDEDELFFNNIYIGAQRQIKPKTYLLGEAMYFWNYNSFVGSIAMKFIIKTRFSLIVGLMPIWQHARISANRSSVEGGVLPVIAFRMWLNRN